MTPYSKDDTANQVAFCRLGQAQLSERMLGAVVVSVAVKAVPPVATITAIDNREE
jgi:hypothetical protein